MCLDSIITEKMVVCCHHYSHWHLNTLEVVQDHPPPHTLKMDYLCSQSDHISSQYLGDTTMDYNNIEYN